MEKQKFETAVKAAKEKSKKRKFKQGIEIIINLRGLDFKKIEQKININVTLPYDRGREGKVGCFVAPELFEQSKNCDIIVKHAEFGNFKDKKAQKKLADSCDWFIAQATVMPDVAKTFGRVFGPRQKMPDPKAGCVVPPNANLKPLVNRLKKTIKIKTGDQFNVKALVGKEDTEDGNIVANIEAIYNAVVGKLPQGEANVKSVLVKTSMGMPITVGVEQ